MNEYQPTSLDEFDPPQNARTSLATTAATPPSSSLPPMGFGTSLFVSLLLLFLVLAQVVGPTAASSLERPVHARFALFLPTSLYAVVLGSVLSWSLYRQQRLQCPPLAKLTLITFTVVGVVRIVDRIKEDATLAVLARRLNLWADGELITARDHLSAGFLIAFISEGYLLFGLFGWEVVAGLEQWFQQLRAIAPQSTAAVGEGFRVGAGALGAQGPIECTLRSSPYYTSHYINLGAPPYSLTDPTSHPNSSTEHLKPFHSSV